MRLIKRVSGHRNVDPAAIIEALIEKHAPCCRSTDLAMFGPAGAINCGGCGTFAEELIAALPGAEARSTGVSGPWPGHTWVEWEGRYYDSEAPRGVMNWQDLPIFRRHGKAWRPHGRRADEKPSSKGRSPARKLKVIVYGGDGRPMPVPGLDLSATSVRYIAAASRKAASVERAIRVGSVDRVYLLTRFMSHGDEARIRSVKDSDVEIIRIGPARAGLQQDRVRSEVGVADIQPAKAPTKKPQKKPQGERYPEIGTMTDGAVAKLHGVTRTAVTIYRLRRGIPAFKPPLDKRYPEAGTMTDRDVAKLHGVAHVTVFDYRRRRGIPDFRSKVALRDKDLKKQGPTPKHLLPKLYPLAGGGTDKEVAALYGIHTSTLREYRVLRGIPAYTPKLSTNYPEVGTMPDKTVALIHGVTPSTITEYRRLRGIARWANKYPEIGTMPDVTVGRMYGVSGSTIGKYRKRRGIPRYRPSDSES